MARKRINISVSSILYNRLQVARGKCGFSTICQMVTSMLDTYCHLMDVAEKRAEPDEISDSEEIRKLFEEYEYWEPQPDEPYVRHNNRSNGER